MMHCNAKLDELSTAKMPSQDTAGCADLSTEHWVMMVTSDTCRGRALFRIASTCRLGMRILPYVNGGCGSFAHCSNASNEWDDEFV